MHDGHEGHSRHEHGSGHEPVSDSQRLKKMIEHWLGHSDDHARSYGEWAQKARLAGREDVAKVLEELAAETLDQKRKIEKALQLLEI